MVVVHTCAETVEDVCRRDEGCCCCCCCYMSITIEVIVEIGLAQFNAVSNTGSTVLQPFEFL